MLSHYAWLEKWRILKNAHRTGLFGGLNKFHIKIMPFRDRSFQSMVIWNRPLFLRFFSIFLLSPSKSSKLRKIFCRKSIVLDGQIWYIVFAKLWCTSDVWSSGTRTDEEKFSSMVFFYTLFLSPEDSPSEMERLLSKESKWGSRLPVKAKFPELAGPGQTFRCRDLQKQQKKEGEVHCPRVKKWECSSSPPSPPSI